MVLPKLRCQQVIVMVILVLTSYAIVHFFAVEHIRRYSEFPKISSRSLASAVRQVMRGQPPDDHHLHHDDSAMADKLRDKVRVLCWVMTCADNHQTKAAIVKETWGQRCNKLLFISDDSDTKLPAIQVKSGKGRDNLSRKTMLALDYVYENHFQDADWFMKADDDTFVIPENLRYFLSEKSPDDPEYFGHHFKTIVPGGYFSGGGGYVMSREALKRFHNRKPGDYNEKEGSEDVAIGFCMLKLGVKAGDSRDVLGRSRFHCFKPQAHLHDGVYPDWYHKYDKYGAKAGASSVSDYAISFHYINPQDMLDLDFFVYHLRPYGLFLSSQSLNGPPPDTGKSVDSDQLKAILEREQQQRKKKEDERRKKEEQEKDKQNREEKEKEMKVKKDKEKKMIERKEKERKMKEKKEKEEKQKKMEEKKVEGEKEKKMQLEKWNKLKIEGSDARKVTIK